MAEKNKKSEPVLLGSDSSITITDIDVIKVVETKVDESKGGVTKDDESKGDETKEDNLKNESHISIAQELMNKHNVSEIYENTKGEFFLNTNLALLSEGGKKDNVRTHNRKQ